MRVPLPNPGNPNGTDLCLPDENALMKLVVAGGETAYLAFGLLHKEYAPPLYGFLGNRLSLLGEKDIEDVVQKTFLSVWLSAATYNPRSPNSPKRSFLAWVCTIAKHHALDLLKEKFKTQGLPPDLEDPGPGCEPTSNRLLDGLREIIKTKLSDEEREVLLAKLDNYDVEATQQRLSNADSKELQKRLGKTAAAIRKCWERALEKIRMALEDRGFTL